MADTIAKRLQSFFSIGIQKKKTNIGSNDKELVITTQKKNDSGKEITRKVKFPSYVKKLWDSYLSQTADSSETLKHRFDRYSDLEYMVYNDTVISMAADLYADEASQADVQTKPIEVEAKKPKVKNRIISLLEQWGIDQTYVREAAWNIAVYGDSFDINVYGKEGIEEVIPQDVHNIIDRLEFKASEVVKKLKGNKRTFINRDPALKDLVKELSSVNNEQGLFHKSYLLGFQLEGDLFLPPWGVNHYRNFSRKSEFWPFGRSIFIYSIGPFRQLKTAKNLMALSRMLKFPKEKFEVKVSESMTEVEQWEAVNEARQEYQNLGVNNVNKDEFSAGSEIWVPEGLIRHSTMENNLRIEDIADVEYLRDDMIIGTRVPKGYLITDRASFGTSGQSLLQQFKPFGRAVYSVQSVILEQLTKLIKMHFLMTEEFEKEMTEFQLSMNFPVTEESSDRLRMKQDSLRLANDIISNIQSALGTRDGLPPDVIETIFSKISFLEPEEVKDIIKRTVKGLGLDTPEDETDSNNKLLFDNLNKKEKDRLLNEHQKMRNRLNEEIICDAYFSALKTAEMKEGVANSRHFRTSMWNTNEENQIFNLLRKNKTMNMKG